MLSRPRAIAELTLAAVIWGFAFIATTWALAGTGPLWLTALRFLGAAAIGLPLVLAVPGLRTALSREQLALAAPAGVLLSASLILQTAGLQYTTATNSGFITTLYVLFVPLLSWQRVRRVHALFVAIALVGTALICRLEEAAFNIGDLLTLACAVLAAAHILWLSAIGSRIASPLVFNVYQSLWAGLVGLAVAAPFEPLGAWPMPPRALAGLGFLVVVSTLLAFYLQVRAQRVLPASLVSLLCLLESPAAAVFAFTLLGDRLGATQWVGAVLILGAAAAAVSFEKEPARAPPS